MSSLAVHKTDVRANWVGWLGGVHATSAVLVANWFDSFGKTVERTQSHSSEDENVKRS